MPDSKTDFWTMIHPEKFLICILGGIIYAFGVNLFIVPFGLYSGGLVGIAQLVRTLLADYIHIDFGSRVSSSMPLTFPF